MLRHTKGPLYENCRASSPAFSPDFAYCDFCSRKTLLEENIKREKNLGSAIFQCLNSIPLKDMKTHLKNWIKRLKLCISHGHEFLKDLENHFGTVFLALLKIDPVAFIFEHPSLLWLSY
jgi:hypothetical protein